MNRFVDWFNAGAKITIALSKMPIEKTPSILG